VDAAAETTGGMAGADGGGSGGNPPVETVDTGAETIGANAGADGGDDLAPGAGGTPPPRLAANGVPIPTPALANDSCAFLEIETVACTMDSECQPVSCNCGGTPVVFDKCWNNCIIGCMGKCITGVSCAAACATTTPSQRVLACLTSNPSCKSDADCKQTSVPYKCLVPPSSAGGECVTGEPGAPCLADADCKSQTCIVTREGLGVCGGAYGGGQCNTDEQCPVFASIVDGGVVVDGGPVDGGGVGICAIAAGAFVGGCTPGTQRLPCATQHDCLPSLECAVISTEGRVCTSRRQGAPCGADADCASGFFCVGNTCSTVKGAQGVSCVTQVDCQAPLECVHITTGAYLCSSRGKGAPCGDGTDCDGGFPFCVNQTCSAGAPGDHCLGDSDCQGFCAQGTCSDGKLGSPCKFGGGGCIAGLVCAHAGPLICVEPDSQDAGGQ
jgi:hypothetical protein